jgi:transcriptional regulator GlxA family with amidase domain
MTTRRYLSTTPRGLVMELRLRHAALLLSTTSDSVRTIAARCGIENFPYFSTSFRRAYHLTPRDYRARHRRGLPPR